MMTDDFPHSNVPTAVKRIFLTLAVTAAVFMVITIVLGLNVGDARSADPQTQARVSTHMLTGMGALGFALLVHAICLTYFMGTGRWLEETSNAYSLDNAWYEKSKKIKYGLLPGMTTCLVLLISTGAMGAVADPATMTSWGKPFGWTDAQLHFFTACTTLVINLAINFSEFIAISKNTAVVEGVMGEVRRIRMERGLPV